MSATYRSLGRAAPIVGGLAVAVYAGKLNIRNDDALPILTKAVAAARPTSLFGAAAPFTPLCWGTNEYLTLSPDPTVKSLKRPTPMAALGATPVHDLVVHEKYGAVIDARGDVWMWGKGYDPSGDIGRSLRGKNLRTLAAGPGKLFGLSQDGRLYVISADRAFQESLAKKRNYWKKLTTRDPIVDFVELQASEKFHWGEKWDSVAVGRNHLLAVTNKGRTFSLPLSPSANTHRQLGTKQTFTSELKESPEKALKDGPPLPPQSDPRFATTLTQIPALAGIKIDQVAASDRSSFVRTDEGRVLGFGANDFGQIGLGPNSTVATVPTPVEIVLAKGYPAGTSLKCTNITAGASTTMFTVEREAMSGPKLYDLLSCGNGQSGSLGTGSTSSGCYAPTRIKALSGIEEYSEKLKGPIGLNISKVSISCSPNTHVFAVLDTVSEADAKGLKDGLFGRDVLVWGGNFDYQLGNGKKSGVAVPQHMPSLIPHAIDELIAESPEAESSPMPLTRLQLHTAKADTYDMLGKLIKRGVKTEETVFAGYNCSVLYNKIVS
ncbi:uncharacterized protein CcaverHIS019_0508870 [Cutaneotrichosporon cavernicola]|uniref:RCC1/BLIP-II protein n=1 Tax=Cutaneotrichosporon cavernicola TaxID=279322 RepID=A0AA48L769_9TREE|nr:uncharacterized protein CcaverHIS019_0508870 [Cutaneotrichosporon cavernicola]BEI93259.1 hypothetical protein CcaverHIS019_0508870 [Cutaneotrichosporon cavernicola]